MKYRSEIEENIDFLYSLQDLDGKEDAR